MCIRSLTSSSRVTRASICVPQDSRGLRHHEDASTWRIPFLDYISWDRVAESVISAYDMPEVVQYLDIGSFLVHYCNVMVKCRCSELAA